MHTDALAKLIDRTQIADLLSRYFGALDDDRLDQATVDATFAIDGKLMRPNGGVLVGRGAIVTGQNESLSRFRATHHVTSDLIVDVDGDTARVRANLTAMHLWADQERDSHSLETYFLAGGVFLALAVRTVEGWRLSELQLRNTWRTGTGLSAMSASGVPDSS